MNMWSMIGESDDDEEMRLRDEAVAQFLGMDIEECRELRRSACQKIRDYMKDHGHIMPSTDIGVLRAADEARRVAAEVDMMPTADIPDDLLKEIEAKVREDKPYATLQKQDGSVVMRFRNVFEAIDDVGKRNRRAEAMGLQVRYRLYVEGEDDNGGDEYD